MNVSEWLDSLRVAWLERDPVAISELFSAGAVYYQGPLTAPRRGRSEIAVHWRETLSRQQRPLPSVFESLWAERPSGETPEIRGRDEGIG